MQSTTDKVRYFNIFYPKNQFSVKIKVIKPKYQLGNTIFGFTNIKNI